MSDFFTAVSFGKNCTSNLEKFIEGVEDYFYLGVKQKQCVISGQENQKSKATILLEQKTTLAFLKVLSYLTAFIPLFMLALKGILRCTHQYHIIDPKQKLEEGMNISPETIQKVEATTKKILAMPNEDFEEIEPSENLNEPNFVEDPAVINDDLRAAFYFEDQISPRTATFQMYPQASGEREQAEEQFQHMIKANEACIYHNFDHLIIPHARVIATENSKLIAREGMQVLEREMAHSNKPETVAMVKESVRQLTRFVIEAQMTGKICIKDSEGNGPKKFVLLDPKPISGSVLQALFGGHEDIVVADAPLINAFSSEELIDTVIEEAHKYDLTTVDVEARIKVSRMEQIQANPMEEPLTHPSFTI